MDIRVLTLFPGLFEPFLREGIVGRAVSRGLVRFGLVDFREFAPGRHRQVDDRPYGGGPGMILKPEPVFDAMEHVLAEFEGPPPRPILLTPQGRRFDQEAARRLARREALIMLCGRYEGFDERIRLGFDWEEISVGDFVLNGGEVAAMCVAEAVIRLLPGVLGHEDSAGEDSFSDNLLEWPQYTRPARFRGMTVPDVLLSGDHEKIRDWRLEMARRRTRERRPDLEQDRRQEKQGKEHDA